jgi:hypothetical protein
VKDIKCEGVKTWVRKKVEKLYDRAGLWETKSKQAALKCDFDRAGRLRTKALQLVAEARRIEEKIK